MKQTETIYSRTRLLARLETMKADSSPALTFYFAQGSTEIGIKKEISAFPGIADVPPSVQKEVAKSTNGAILFWGLEYKYLVLPPFPVRGKVVLPGYQADELVNILKKDYLAALILIRMGAYGIGLFDGEKLLDSKVGTGLVHARHKKGGSSQRRYERHRDKQIEYFFTRVCAHVREKLENHLASIQLLYFGGERNTIRLFLGYCDFLKPLDSRTSGRLLNIREPGQKALVNSIHGVYSSRVIEFTEE